MVIKQNEEDKMSPITYFAPAERIASQEIINIRETLKENLFLNTSLDCLPVTVLVLNKYRQVVFCNKPLLNHLGIETDDPLLGLRPGELLQCIHSDKMPGGCGTSEFCEYCGAVNAIMECLKGNPETRECRITVKKGEDLLSCEFRVTAVPIYYENELFICFTILDISDEKRKLVLNHLFLHDVSNTVTILQTFIDLLNLSDNYHEIKRLTEMLPGLSKQLIEEIQMHKQLLLAENGDLKLKITHIPSTRNFLIDLVANYSEFSFAKGKTIQIDIKSTFYELETDFIVLKRVLGNMLKNALEASTDEDKITVGCYLTSLAKMVFYVHNPQILTNDVKHQIFQRSFSTKGEHRGLGTYSIKLLGEKYLKGKVTFTTDEKSGTTFFLEVPLYLNTN